MVNDNKNPIKYKDFFTTVRRLNSKQKISIVKGDKFLEFIKAIISDDDIKREWKAFVITCLCGGLRVSEGISITKKDFYEEDGNLFCDVKVLKKRDEEIERTIMIHPEAADFIRSFIKDKIGEIFSFTRDGALRMVKRYFGVDSICTHSFRHSAISFYIGEAGLSREETSQLVEVTNKIIDTYLHLNKKRILKKAFR